MLVLLLYFTEIDYVTVDDWLAGRLQSFAVSKHCGSGATADSGIGGSTYSTKGTTDSSGYSGATLLTEVSLWGDLMPISAC